MDLLVKNIESKHVLWLENRNQYLILESDFLQVLKEVLKFKTKLELLEFCTTNLCFSAKNANIIIDTCVWIRDENKSNFTKKPLPLSSTLPNITSQLLFTYCYNSKRIKVQYSSEELAQRLHHKYKHLCEKYAKNSIVDASIIIQEFMADFYLIVNGVCIGKWKESDFHFMQGKFSMSLLNLFNTKTDEDWLAVLHASAVSIEDNSIVFLGESGSGKSTATALLTLNGFDLLADDFVPIDAVSQCLVSFPAAISIKESVFEMFEPYFPELINSPIREKNNVTKFKYLYPYSKNNLQCRYVNTKALVFIKYSANTANSLIKISKISALERLIPDSWISPNRKNVTAFLNWVISVPCYTLEYNQPTYLIDVSLKLIDNEL